MFRKNDNQSNERVIFQAKPNLILGCKKAILGIILLIFVLFISGPIIKFIGNMQVYMISQIKLPLTRYVAIAVFVVMLIIIVYIILQIVGWYAKEYILTDSKIIVKSGVIFTRKNYMPYATIQDVNTSQSIFARLFNVGSVSVYSAYDNNQIALENISEPSKVEEIIFSNMSRGHYQSPEYYPGDSDGNYYQAPQQDYRRDSYNDYYQAPQQDYQRMPRQNYHQSFHGDYSQEYQQENLDNYYPEEDYDDVDVITPIHQEEQYQRRRYDYYPDDLNYYESKKPKYEYEPYHENLEHNINRAMYEEHNSYSNSRNSYRDDSHYYQENSNNYYSDYDKYDNSVDEFSYNEDVVKNSTSQKNNVDDSSEKVIKRHFDKFKR